MTNVFYFAWLTKSGNCTWKVCSIQGLTKGAGQMRLSWVTEMQDIEWLNSDILNSFDVFVSVKLIWNVMAIYRQKLITRHFVEFNCNYWEFSISIYAEYGKLWFASVYVENWNYDRRNKFHAIPRFPTGSFATETNRRFLRDTTWDSTWKCNVCEGFVLKYSVK